MKAKSKKRIVIGAVFLILTLIFTVLTSIHYSMNKKFDTNISQSILLQRIFWDFDVATKDMEITSTLAEDTDYRFFEIKESQDSSYTLIMNESNQFSCLLDGDKVLLGMRYIPLPTD